MARDTGTGGRLRRNTRRLSWIGVMTSAGLLAAATLAAPPWSPAAPPGSLTKVTILSGGQVIGWAPAYLALGMGLFRAEGLDVDYSVAAQSAPAAVAAVVSGSAFMAFTGAPVVINAVRGGSPVRIVLVDYAEYSAELTASNKFLASRKVSPQSPLEQKVKALKGAKIAIDLPGDSNSQFARFMLQEYGINPDTEVELVSMQGIPSKMAALERGSVDLMVASPPSGEEMEQRGVGKVYIRPREDPRLRGYPYLVGSANLKDISGRPRLVKGVIKAMARAMRMIRAQPAPAKPIVRKYFENFSPAVFDLAYENMLGAVPADPVLTRDQFTKLKDFARLQGKPIEITYDEAVNRQLAAEAVRELGP